MAVAYGQEGAIVVSVARTITELEQTEELIRSKGGDVLTLQVDLSSEIEILKIRKIILAEYRGIDILVNNAAISPWKTIEDTNLEDWDKTIAVNVRAPFLLCKAFMDSMQSRGGGSIINVSSKSAEMGFVGESAYCPSKYGLEGLTQCLALELKPRNIAVNSLNVSAPNGMSLKPTGLTLEELKTVTQEVVDRYADVESMVKGFSDAWVFLALQDGDGVTGQRFITSKLSKELESNLTNLQQSIYNDVQEHFNINSPQQLGAILFDKLEIHKKLKIRKRYRHLGGISFTIYLILF